MIEDSQPMHKEAFREIGEVGINEFDGQIIEDNIKKLRHLRTRNKVYKEMSNDPVVGAILFAVEMHMRKASWNVEPCDEDNNQAKERADFVSKALFENMSHTFQDFLSEVLSMLPYGFSVHEIVYKKRDDGKIIWKKWPIRAQNSIWSWDFDKEGGLDGVWQEKRNPSFKKVFIPMEKMLLFRPSSYKNNPEGRSVLRTAYRPYYFKSRIEKIEAIGIERNLSGYPVLNVPTNVFAKNELAKAQREYAEKMVTRIRKDEQMGAVLPPGWELELLSASNSNNSNTGEVISRYSLQIAQSLLSDIIMLGHYRAGSYALSEQKYELFVTALDSWLDSIQEVINRYAVPRLMKLNGYTNEALYPSVNHDPVSKIDPQELANVLFRMMNVKAVKPDDKLEKYLRNFLGLPLRDPKTERQIEENDSRSEGSRTDTIARPADTEGDNDQSTISHD